MKNMVIILCCVFVFSCSTKKTTNATATLEEFPTKSETLWTDKTELFVEFPALVVNEPSRFAAHFTQLKKHLPVTEGSVTVNLIKKGEVVATHTVNVPSSPGIFSPTITPKTQGNFQLIFKINTPTYKDELIIEDVIVYHSKAIAIEALGTSNESGGITFLKEQAWKMDFQTAPVLKKEVHEAIKTFGIWEAAPSDFETLVANASGKVTFTKNITVGTSIKKGETIMTISSRGFVSNNLTVELEKAKAVYQQSEANYNRKKELFDSKIIAKSEWEQVERDYTIAKENYQNLAKGYSSKGKGIRAPFNGYIQSLNVSNGSYVSEGSSLFIITDSKSSLLKIQVSPKYSNILQHIDNIWYQTDDTNWSNIKSTNGEILSVDKTVSLEKPMLLVYAKVNDAISMPIGGVTQATLSVGKPEIGLVIPTSALLEDYGNYTVIVQLSGESFEKRQVTIGKQNGDEVQILLGLKAGEYVVSKGAYQVKTASMSGEAPAHGHAH
ncbi:efflux RND transporter periplasmic adaptor subunit [Tenacibaculum larymnensis]|uniref:Efflux RND transporter periplasmic adaptor subunit n=1 Tax=Tenacibaculum larymnensis TaxID=2878201 RepID=A0A9X4EQX7_9FLAO|nr:efflux RND transporter periplasmic adaptor subunit [Tenacibaculum larymnensis]MDE1207644.1 efflux RND transporter periplasmic adaptor subunit [Tenacibaculum larymnensis]